VEGRAAELSESGVAVRPAAAADVPLLAAIEVAAGERFRSVGMDDIADDEPLPEAELLAAVADGRLWVAELGAVAELDDGDRSRAIAAEGAGQVGPAGAAGVAVVGYALAIGDAGHAHLEQVSVVPWAGGRGVGAALVDAVAEWGRRQGASSLTLATFAELPWNAPWYRRLGFEVVPEEELDDELRAVIAHEVALGLDVSARVCMRRPLT
jgi:ribosomal protein S18 acetylase RimI-like enzyme